MGQYLPDIGGSYHGHIVHSENSGQKIQQLFLIKIAFNKKTDPSAHFWVNHVVLFQKLHEHPDYLDQISGIETEGHILCFVGIHYISGKKISPGPERGILDYLLQPNIQGCRFQIKSRPVFLFDHLRPGFRIPGFLSGHIYLKRSPALAGFHPGAG